MEAYKRILDTGSIMTSKYHQVSRWSEYNMLCDILNITKKMKPDAIKLFLKNLS